MSNSQVQEAIERITLTRQFTDQFLQGLTNEEWFWHPREYLTHIAWQVGHLAMAQYFLCLQRVRGRAQEDASLIPNEFVELFKIGSTPTADSAKYPTPAEIQRVFEAIHHQTLSELADRTDQQLDIPLEQPHPVFKTKLGAVQWCPQHELVHAGQIAMLRRLMGKAPLR
ncbi:MAG: DinB family protein [Planctomycetes bacterium]|nr:DinB family protein [Planctomycetota bacterium]